MLNQMLQGSDGWRNRLASRFRKSNSDQYDLEEAEAAEGLELRDYLSEISAPKTEPTRRRPMNIEDNSGEKAAAARKEKRERTKSRIEGDQVRQSRAVGHPQESHLGFFNQVEAARGGRKSSYILPGDYDSELVDGKYVTSVPIISVEDADEKEGNIRYTREK